jgi:hypothetical protein
MIPRNGAPNGNDRVVRIRATVFGLSGGYRPQPPYSLSWVALDHPRQRHDALPSLWPDVEERFGLGWGF